MLFHRQNEESVPVVLKDMNHKPSFIRRRQKPSIRGETFRSSLIKNRKEVIYIPISD